MGGGELTNAKYEEDILLVDGWIKLAMPQFLREALLVIRQRLDNLFDGWVEERTGRKDVGQNVLIEQGGAQLLQAVVQLLSAQEETAPEQRAKTLTEKQQDLVAAEKALSRVQAEIDRERNKAISGGS